MVHPGLQASQGQWAPAPRPVGGLGKAAAILAFVTAAGALAHAAVFWHGYGLARDYVAGGGTTVADLQAADSTTGTLALLYLAALVATAVLLIVWLYQAQVNAELMCTAQHRRSRGWVIGAWFCPLVNLWFPAMIVEDVYRASMPSTRHDQVSFHGEPGVPLIRLWWSPFVLSGVFATLAERTDDNLDGLHATAVELLVSALFLAVSAVSLTVLVRRVSAWQLVPKVR